MPKSAGMSVVLYKNRAVLWGGYTGGSSSFNSVVTLFDLDAKEWVKPPPRPPQSSSVSPPARSGHSAVLWPAVPHWMVVFGGCGPSMLSDVSILDLETMEWMTLPSRHGVTGRFRHSAMPIDDELGVGMIMFGGCGARCVHSNLLLMGRLRKVPMVSDAARELAVIVAKEFGSTESSADGKLGSMILELLDPLLPLLSEKDIENIEERLRREKLRMGDSQSTSDVEMS